MFYSTEHDYKERTMAKITELTPGTWTVDQSHSAIAFSARHLMISKVRGRFESFRKLGPVSSNGWVGIAAPSIRD